MVPELEGKLLSGVVFTPRLGGVAHLEDRAAVALGARQPLPLCVLGLTNESPHELDLLFTDAMRLLRWFAVRTEPRGLMPKLGPLPEVDSPACVAAGPLSVSVRVVFRSFEDGPGAHRLARHVPKAGVLGGPVLADGFLDRRAHLGPGVESGGVRVAEQVGSSTGVTGDLDCLDDLGIGPTAIAPLIAWLPGGVAADGTVHDALQKAMIAAAHSGLRLKYQYSEGSSPTTLLLWSVLSNQCTPRVMSSQPSA